MMPPCLLRAGVIEAEPSCARVTQGERHVDRPTAQHGTLELVQRAHDPKIATERDKMFKIAALGLGILAVGFDLARAQDIAGIEDCTKAVGLDKRTGCLQSNVNFLQQLVTKNAAEARQRLNAANNEIVALKSVVTSLQASVEELRAAQKAAADKKPESK